MLHCEQAIHACSYFISRFIAVHQLVRIRLSKFICYFVFRSRINKMARGGKQFTAWKGGKKDKKIVGKDGDTILRVDPWSMFGKHTLQAYVQNGCAMYVPRKINSEKKFLKVSKLIDSLDTNNSELCRRLPYG